MERTNKVFRLINAITASTLVLIVTISFVCNLLFFQKTPKDLVYTEFKSDFSEIQIVASALEKIEYDWIYITIDSDKNVSIIGDSLTMIYETVQIEDKISNIISNLIINQKYKYIEKRGNSIYFNKYSHLSSGYGIAYSMDGQIPDSFDLRECIPMSEKYWYYCVID